MRDELAKQWGNISTYRAARIARSEIVNASNLGSLAGAAESGVPLLKVWLSTRDSRTRRDTPGGQYPMIRLSKPGRACNIQVIRWAVRVTLLTVDAHNSLNLSKLNF
jgi:hypothetical protein